MNNMIKRISALATACTLGLCAVAPCALADKKETVFVMADANGNANRVVVSNRLYNDDRLDVLTDYSTLDDIENVGGGQSFTNENGVITWQANGEDIHYEGTSDQPIPVAAHITYKLDGKEIDPAELKGKSGHLDIEMRFEAVQTVSADMDGVAERIPLPFMTASIMFVDSDIYKNVEIENGRLVDVGNMQVAVCVGFPGVSEALDLDRFDDLDVDLPTTATISADVTDYASSGMYIIATNNGLEVLDVEDDDLSDKLDDLKDVDFGELKDDLTDAIEQLKDGSDALFDGAVALRDGAKALRDGAGDLNDGARDLYDGVGELRDGAERLNDGTSDMKDGAEQLNDGARELYDGTGDLNSGANELKDGARTLADGLEEIDSNSFDLVDGARQIFEGIIDTANDELHENEKDFKKLKIELHDITIDNYAEEISRLETELLDNVEDYVYQQANAQLRDKVEDAVYNEVVSLVRAGAKKKVRVEVTKVARQQVREKVEEAAKEKINAEILKHVRAEVEAQAQAYRDQGLDVEIRETEIGRAHV